ncbi:MAG: ABC transporter permease [Clostridia bacterium]|nr:ABC transporter permease [Clostridia bacterium]
MTNRKNTGRGFGFHIVKRDAISPIGSVLIRALAIIASLIICTLVILSVTRNSSNGNASQLIKSMLYGNFGTSRKIWQMVMNVSILQCISLAVTPAFKMKFWNLGAEGQALVGALVSVILMFILGDTLPMWMTLVVIAVAAMISGCIWGLLPAIFKAKFGTNETLFTLMMNYIAMQLVLFSIPFIDKSGSNVIRSIQSPFEGQRYWFPEIFGSRYGLILIISVVLTVLMFVYLKFSKHGYEISVVGESENTAKYIGINVKKVVLRTMTISGLLCGLVGFIFAVGKDCTVNANTIGGIGFTAVMVSWLAKFNPIIMTAASFLIVFLEIGSSQFIEDCKLDNSSITGIIIGIVLFFVIGCEFFANYKIQANTKGEHRK